MKNPGYIVEFEDKDGNIIRGYLYHDKQEKAFQAVNKVRIDYEKDGRKIVALKDENKVKPVGYVD